jgi:REP element-mobilizing transposase RayT
MSRALRIEYENAWHHVMNRGANRIDIFKENSERLLFLELLEQIHTKYKVETHAYCLMNNHYHLLLKTSLANLSQAMHHLNGTVIQRGHPSSDKTLINITNSAVSYQLCQWCEYFNVGAIGAIGAIMLLLVQLN